MSTEASSARLQPSNPTGPGAAAGTDDAALPGGLAREALQMSLRLLERVETRRRPAEMCQALAEVGRCLKSLAAYSAAESYLRQALRWATLVDAVDARVELICELAEVASAAADALVGVRGEGEPVCGGCDARDAGCDIECDVEAGHACPAGAAMAGRAARERARDLAFDAATLATRTADTHWEAKVLLRVSDVLARCGDRDDAATMQQRALVLLGLTDVPLAAGSLAHATAHTCVAGPTTLM